MEKTTKMIVLIFVTLISLLVVSCKDHDLYDDPGTTCPKQFNDFHFFTTQDITLQVNYQNMGGIQAGVNFQVYDQMPVEEHGNKYVKKEGVEPIFADRTTSDGTFSKKITIPAYAKTLYIYTPAFYAQTLLEAKVEGKTAIANDDEISEVRSKATGYAFYECQPVRDGEWYQCLGDYEKNNGFIQYEYQGSDLNLSRESAIALYIAQSNVIDVNKKCPEEYRASKDMFVNEQAEIAVTILGGNTCWNSSMGYYFYEDGHAPASLKDAHVILIFPNTQDGMWSNNRPEAWRTRGVDRGATVQLKYYPNIAKNGSMEGETTVFPAGIRIGFVLAANGWTNRIGSFTGDKKYRAATSQGLSVDNTGELFNTPRTAIYRYKNKDEEANTVIFSFEDYITDENFSDVVFTLQTNPVEAITDIPVVSENKTSVKVLKGVYAFEDLWPEKGDYDMNDVLLVCNYGKTYDASTLDKGLYEETFYFKTFQNYAEKDNGLGLTLINGGKDATVKLTIDDKDIAFTREGDVYLLTGNVKEYMNKEYKLTLTYKNPIKKAEASVRPFIWRKGSTGNWEVHISKEAPTSLVDFKYFGTEDDASDISKGVYYVREGNYPFAFFLAGATESCISRLLDAANERKAIDSDDMYPDYKDWVTSDGISDQDWYKK